MPTNLTIFFKRNGISVYSTSVICSGFYLEIRDKQAIENAVHNTCRSSKEMLKPLANSIPVGIYYTLYKTDPVPYTELWLRIDENNSLPIAMIKILKIA